MAETNETERIKQAMATGRLSVPDATGMQHFIYGRCPIHGEASPVYRTEKSGDAFSRLIFRCPSSGDQFSVGPEEMFLQ